MPSTIEDVAKRAGVSPSLVSRYLNGKPGVSEKSRAKIAAGIKACNYVPNALAQSLARLKTNMIGVISETIVSDFETPLINGLAKAAYRRGYGVSLTPMYSLHEARQRIKQYVSSGMLDGVIVYGTILDDRDFVEKLSNIRRPIVLVESDVETLNVDKVIVDNIGGIYEVTQYLLSKGITRPMFLPWRSDIEVGRARMNGFIRAIKDAGLPFEDSMIMESVTEAQAERVFELVRDLNQRGALPEAILCGADRIALYVLSACRRLHIDVPGRLSITGFDGEDYRMELFGYPTLTTVYQPLAEMGRLAADMLIDRIEMPGRQAVTLTIRPKLVVGGSSL